jgi:hypothetical protein
MSAAAAAVVVPSGRAGIHGRSVSGRRKEDATFGSGTLVG